MKEIIFFHSDLKVLLVVVVPAILERFILFLIGLIDLDDSCYFNFCVYFSKDLCMPKMLFQKIKPVISSCFLYI